MFINGKIVATYTDEDYSGSIRPGGYDAGGTQFDQVGNTTDLQSFLELQFIQQRALHLLRPPIYNTVLHLPMAGGGIIDKAQTTNTLKLYGNAKSSTSYTKCWNHQFALDGTVRGD